MASVNAVEQPAARRERQPLITRSDASYENATLTEDVTWRGNILIRGAVVIAPQATVRVEPGTIICFIPSPVLHQSPRLVVMGRLFAVGTADRPVVFAPNSTDPQPREWGGIVFLGSEKRNQLEQVRIDGAETAIQTHFSSLSAKAIAIARSTTALSVRDSSVAITGAAISGCDKGLEIEDSEVELRESTLNGNRQGISTVRSGVMLASVSVKGSARGLASEECRLRVSASEFTGNGVGASIKGGEGQVQSTVFAHNREQGLQLSGARLKIHRCVFADNAGDGIRVDDGRSMVTASAFSGNKGYNFANAGREEVSVIQNWWGAADEAGVMAKILDSSRDQRSGEVIVFPWLLEKPALLP